MVIPATITSSWTLIQTSKIKKREKFSEPLKFQHKYYFKGSLPQMSFFKLTLFMKSTLNEEKYLIRPCY
jgi:hypothetical protein